MNPENRDGAANAYTRIYDVVRRIPAGKVATYGQVALLAGNPRWARVVGYALHVNPMPGVIPCHRVVGAGGSLTGDAGGVEKKLRLLTLEGVSVEGLSIPLRGTAL